MNRIRWIATATVLLVVSTACLASGSSTATMPQIERWLETDRGSYGVGEPVRVAFCLHNTGIEDIGLAVEGADARLAVGSLGIVETSAAPEPEVREIVLPRGETKVFRFTIDPGELAIPTGVHQITGTLQPVVGPPLQAIGQFIVSPLPDYLKVADVLAAPHLWQEGDVVELRGEYRGTRARPYRPLDGVESPRATDWILGDETGEIYVHNSPSKEYYNDWTWHIDDPRIAPSIEDGTVSSPVLLYNFPEVGDQSEFLHPDWTYGKRVIVRGHVITHDDGLVTVAPVEIFKWQTDRGIFCVLETAGPPQSAEPGGHMLLRMILTNDTAFPLHLAHASGHKFDFIVEKDGQEVWRWSRHQARTDGLSWLTVNDDSWQPGPNSRRVDRSNTEAEPHEGNRPANRWSIPPDNSLVYTAHWPMVDNEGRPVESGIYQVYGFISHRVFTYPVPVAVGHPAAE